MDYVLVFLGGLLGSAHCVGMCGPIALMVSNGGRGARQMCARQVQFTLGRLVTYTLLGGISGGIGWRVGQSVPPWVNVAAVLAVVAGALLLLEGLAVLGWLPLRRWTTHLPCWSLELIRSSVLGPDKWRGLFLAGSATGLLPCGLLYGFLALAGSSTSVVTGAATMLVFGAGTMPAMVAVGLSGHVLSGTTRARILKFAAVCVIITGVISMGRGLGYWQAGSDPASASCPFCVGR